jgi:hypothetical protein
MWTEGQTDMAKLTVAFRKSAKSALKKGAFHLKVCSTSRNKLAKHLSKRKYFLIIAVEK